MAWTNVCEASVVRYFLISAPNIIQMEWCGQDGAILPVRDTGFVPQGKFIMFWCHIINPLLTKLVRSRLLDVDLHNHERKNNLAKIQPSWPHAWSITHISFDPFYFLPFHWPRAHHVTYKITARKMVCSLELPSKCDINNILLMRDCKYALALKVACWVIWMSE